MVKPRTPAPRTTTTIAHAKVQINDTKIDITTENGKGRAVVTRAGRVLYDGDNINQAFGIFDRNGGVGYLVSGMRALLGMRAPDERALEEEVISDEELARRDRSADARWGAATKPKARKRRDGA